MAQPTKHPKTGIYQTRKRVPPDLRQALGWEFKKSLGTRELSEAKPRHLLALQEADTLFAQVRAGLADKPLTGRDALILAGRWFEQERAAMEASNSYVKWLEPGNPITTPDGEEHPQLVTLEWALDGEPLSVEFIHRHIAKALKTAARPMPPGTSPAYTELSRAFTEHMFKLSELALARHEGDWKRSVETLAHEPLSTGPEAAIEVLGIHDITRA